MPKSPLRKRPFLQYLILSIMIVGTVLLVRGAQRIQNVQPEAQVATTLSMNLFLHGIGNGGDNVNPNSVGNTNPQRLERQVTVDLFNENNQIAGTIQGQVTYDATAGNFQGNINAGSLASGIYTARIKSSQYLSRYFPGIQTVTAGQPNEMPAVRLITGDIDGDNVLTAALVDRKSDYDLLIDCFSELLPARDCADQNKKQMSDLTDDGIVNQFDYNLFLRELAVQPGDGDLTPGPTGPIPTDPIVPTEPGQPTNTIGPTQPNPTATNTPTPTPTRTPTPTVNPGPPGNLIITTGEYSGPVGSSCSIAAFISRANITIKNAGGATVLSGVLGVGGTVDGRIIPLAPGSYTIQVSNIPAGYTLNTSCGSANPSTIGMSSNSTVVKTFVFQRIQPTATPTPAVVDQQVKINIANPTSAYKAVAFFRRSGTNTNSLCFEGSASTTSLQGSCRGLIRGAQYIVGIHAIRLASPNMATLIQERTITIPATGTPTLQQFTLTLPVPTVTPTARPPLMAITKSAAVTQANVGSSFTYTMRVTSTKSLHDATVTDNVDKRLTVTRASTSLGTMCGVSATNQVACNIVISKTNPVTVDIIAKFNATAKNNDIVSNIAQVHNHDSEGGTFTSNTVTVKAIVPVPTVTPPRLPGPVLTVNKIASLGTAVVGQSLTYSISAFSSSTGLENVDITDILDPRLTLVSAKVTYPGIAAGKACDLGGLRNENVKCRTQIKSGSPATATIQVKVNDQALSTSFVDIGNTATVKNAANQQATSQNVIVRVSATPTMSIVGSVNITRPNSFHLVNVSARPANTFYFKDCYKAVANVASLNFTCTTIFRSTPYYQSSYTFSVEGLSPGGINPPVTQRSEITTVIPVTGGHSKLILTLTLPVL